MRSPPASASPAPSATTGPSSISASTRCRSWRPTTCTTRSRRPPWTPGLPVLCEKPLARTVPEAEDLVARAAAAGVVTKLGFVFRYSPALRQLRALVQDGYVGRVHSLTVYSQNPQFMDPSAPFHWKMDGARTGGGVVVEYGSHSLDLARWIAGEIEEVCANARTVVPDRPDPPRSGRRQVDGGRRVLVAGHAGGRRREHVPLELGVDRSALGGPCGVRRPRRPRLAAPGRRLALRRAARGDGGLSHARAAFASRSTHRRTRMGDHVARVLHGQPRPRVRGRDRRRAGRGPDLLRWLSRPAGTGRDRDLARRAALGGDPAAGAPGG